VRDVIFNESTTIGLRVLPATKYGLPRSHATIASRFGPLHAKAVTLPSGKVQINPEYESCKQAALAHNVPLREVMNEAQLMSGQQDSAAYAPG
jgi:uncharacterized protein (DUF111 family)